MNVRKTTSLPLLTSITTTIKFLSFQVCPYKAAQSQPKGQRPRPAHTWRSLLGCNMANFSVEWLSRSYYEEPPLQVHSEVHRETEEFTKEPRREFSPTSPNSKFTAELSTQQRRMRTKFTSEQISTLENTFSRHKYLGATQRKKFAEKLNLSETQVGVKTWFQNRRMKLKREVQDLRPAFLSVPAALLPPQLFQHPGLSGQLPARSGFYPQLQPLHRPGLPAALHPAILPHVLSSAPPFLSVFMGSTETHRQG
uniref:Homeobox domain-containing protein n=1 Tax=Lates calcarifer TaxID=8187 RepID=A0A4W6DA41_LATCA